MAKTLTIVVATDFRIDGTGYQTIAGGICQGLAELGCRVIVVGTGYDGRQHDYPFQVIPSHYSWLPQQSCHVSYAVKADWLLLMMDVPKVIAILRNMHKQVDDRLLPGVFELTKVCAAFPVESYPLKGLWAESLKKYTACRFTFTEFGVRTLRNAGVASHKLTVGVDKFWYEKYETPTELIPEILAKHVPYVITVAYNAFRKNLVETMQVVKSLIEDGTIHSYVLVTDIGGADGWDLVDAAKDIGFPIERLCLVGQGISRVALKALYDNAEAMILLSLAEGIGLPVYEAQARGVPVVAPRHTGVEEVLLDDMLVVKVRDKFLYPWGNVYWHWPDLEDAKKKLGFAITFRKQKSIMRYPGWDKAASEMSSTLQAFERLVDEQAIAESAGDSVQEEEQVGGGYRDTGVRAAGISENDVRESVEHESRPV